ncbi:hypothetical protein [Salibacterium lacus]|uniref:G5 domain-containing protein n=1 Tax=Salibacterium lacus TaxID=1898109 RepID=A0ABW5T0C0_9BACI
MKRNSYIEKAMLLFTCLTGVILLFALGGAAAYEYVWPEEETLPSEAVAGGVDIGGMKRSEAEESVSEEWKNWQQQAGVALRLFDEEVVIEGDRFTAEVKESVQQAFTDHNVPLHVSWNSGENALPEALDRFSFVHLRDRIDMTALNEQIRTIDNVTQNQTQTLDTGTFFMEELPLESTTFNRVTLSPGMSGSALEDWSRALDGYEMEGNSVFSLLEVLEESGNTVYDDPALDALATGIFQVLAATNFELSERHINEELPPYAAPGEGAHVDVPDRGLVFYNPNIYTYQWNVSWNGSELSLSLSGPEFLHSYTLEQQDEQTIQPRTVVQFDENRTSGGRQTIREGENGYYAEAVRVVTDADGNMLKEMVLGQDYYPPEHRVEEESLQTADEKEEELPDIVTDDGEGNENDSQSQMPDEQNEEGEQENEGTNPDSTEQSPPEDSGENEENESSKETQAGSEDGGGTGEQNGQQSIKGYE